ncbi:hypothetical protein DIPPA_15509 [Diplonema papillatum]|nr:hypothetical protein DIPPA_17338 [Diplonema papillatum]KAJ9457334.1 hypothetical protein DIPPA_15509 [Diplonema papillatum]
MFKRANKAIPMSVKWLLFVCMSLACGAVVPPLDCKEKDIGLFKDTTSSIGDAGETIFWYPSSFEGTYPDWIDVDVVLGPNDSAHHIQLRDSTDALCVDVLLGINYEGCYYWRVNGKLMRSRFSENTALHIQHVTMTFNWVTQIFEVEMVAVETHSVLVEGEQRTFLPGGKCATEGVHTVHFGYSGVNANMPTHSGQWAFMNFFAGCKVPPLLTCGNDDALRMPHFFDGAPVGVHNDPLPGNRGSWMVDLVSVGPHDNAAIGGKTNVTLHQPDDDTLGVGITVFFFKAMVAPGTVAAKVESTVILRGDNDTVCATISGTYHNDSAEWGWRVDDADAHVVVSESWSRVELRTQWDKGVRATWTLHVTGEDGLTVVFKRESRMPWHCPNGVKQILFNGDSIWYDNVMMSCNGESYPKASPVSAWGDPHFTDMAGNTFDFMGEAGIPYPLYDDDDFVVLGLMAPCGPSTEAATCFEEVRVVSIARDDFVRVTADNATRIRGCQPVASLPWVEVTGTPGSSVTLMLRDSDGDLLRLVVTSYEQWGGEYVSVHGYPQPLLKVMGLSGILFGTTTDWISVRRAMLKGEQASVPFSLMNHATLGCICPDDFDTGYCTTPPPVDSVFTVPTLAEATQLCGTEEARAYAMACCEKLSTADEYAKTHAQCVFDECANSSSSKGCLGSTGSLLAFTDGTGSVALQLCEKKNVAQDLATLQCTECHEGWYPTPADAQESGVEACSKSDWLAYCADGQCEDRAEADCETSILCMWHESCKTIPVTSVPETWTPFPWTEAPPSNVPRTRPPVTLVPPTFPPTLAPLWVCEEMQWDQIEDTTSDTGDAGETIFWFTAHMGGNYPGWIDVDLLQVFEDESVYRIQVRDSTDGLCAEVILGRNFADSACWSVNGKQTKSNVEAVGHRQRATITFNWPARVFEVMVSSSDNGTVHVEVEKTKLYSGGSCASEGVHTVRLGYSWIDASAYSGAPVYQKLLAGCKVLPLTCGDDDALRRPYLFERRFSAEGLQEHHLDGDWGTWMVDVKQASQYDMVAVGGNTNLTLHQPDDHTLGMGVTVFYFKAMVAASSVATGKVESTVILRGDNDKVCATISGSYQTDSTEWMWQVEGPNSALLKTQKIVSEFSRVELRTEWDKGSKGMWTLYATGKDGLNRVAVRGNTSMAQECLTGVKEILFNGDSIWYDNVMLSCNNESSPTASPASVLGGLGVLHWTDMEGNNFDFKPLSFLPYTLYDDDDLAVYGRPTHCGPSRAGDCLVEVRVMRIFRKDYVLVTGDTVEQRSECSETESLGWVNVTGTPGSLVTLVLHDGDGSAVLKLVVESYEFFGERFVSVYMYPMPVLNTLGVRGMLFGTGTVVMALRASLGAPGGHEVHGYLLRSDRSPSGGVKTCICGVSSGFYCETEQSTKLEVLQVPTLANAKKTCGTEEARIRATACCEKLTTADDEYATKQAQCVSDECANSSSEVSGCLESTGSLLAFTDAWGSVALQLCEKENVVQDLATLQCTQCREGWYPMPADAQESGVEACSKSDWQPTCDRQAATSEPLETYWWVVIGLGGLVMLILIACVCFRCKKKQATSAEAENLALELTANGLDGIELSSGAQIGYTASRD